MSTTVASLIYKSVSAFFNTQAVQSEVCKIARRCNKVDVLTGGTDSRPTDLPVGSVYFDTDLGQPLWYNGTNWVDSTGTQV